VSIGGARNAGLVAVKILATSDAALTTALADYATALAALVEEKNERLKSTR
jgi:5-(carboxyamino)imidazole ribonucleotide mutase